MTVLVVLLFAVAAYYIYDQFREKTVTERIADVIHIEDTRKQTDALKNYLADPDPKVRAKAALAVGRIGAKGAGALLYELVTTDKISVVNKIC